MVDIEKMLKGINLDDKKIQIDDKWYGAKELKDTIKKMIDDGEYEINKYADSLKRLETAKITQRLEASKDGTRYTILDPARLPLRPIKPKKVLVLLFALFAGFCGGGGLVFLAEIFDHSFLGIDEAKEHLELPVLGGISKIITESDVRAQKIRNVKITFASVLVGATLVAAIIFNVILGS